MFKTFSRLCEEGLIMSREVSLQVDEYRNRMDLPTGKLKQFIQALQKYSKNTWRVLRLTYYDSDTRLVDDMLTFKNEYLENSGRYVKFFICNSRDNYDKVCTAVANHNELNTLYEVRPTDTDAREYLWVGGSKLSMYILPKSDKELIQQGYFAEVMNFLDGFKLKIAAEIEEKYPKPDSFISTGLDAYSKFLEHGMFSVSDFLMAMYDIKEEIPDILNFKMLDTPEHFQYMDKAQELSAVLAQLRKDYTKRVQELIDEQRRAYRNWKDAISLAVAADATKDDGGTFRDVLQMYIDQGIVKGIDEKFIYFLCPVTDYDLDDLQTCNSYNDNMEDVFDMFKTMEAQGKHLMMLTQIRYYTNPESADYGYDVAANTGTSMQRFTDGRNCIWNPHVNEYHCYGTFKSFLNDAAYRCDWTNWFAYASQVAHQINFSDDTVFGTLCDRQLSAILNPDNWK